MNNFENETRLWTIQKLINDVDDINEIKQIKEMLRGKIRSLGSENKYKLIKGDKVVVLGTSQLEEGRIEKVKRTRAIVMVEDRKWDVPLYMLRKVN
tara:strand:- start:79 stop:366 length:288 start_codon:yes stop_codon:yes gene_type:complete